jgi:DHA1 family bicyclomycin/chloramphenicol resistance-like MFS transporter
MVSPFAIDTFFPSFPAMQRDLGVSSWQLQQTLTAYLVPYALASLLHGPFSDALGRRRLIIWGTVLFTLGSLACMLAPKFTALLAFRALQGVTAGVGMVVGRAIVRDLYDGPKAQRLMSLVSLLFGIAPAIAPVIGGWIHLAYGWRAVFAFLAAFGLLLVVATLLRLPETHPPAKRVPFAFGSLIRACAAVTRNREFLCLAFAAGLNFVGVFGFIAAAPAIVLGHWQLSETQFWWLFLPVIAGFTLGAAISGRAAGRWPPSRQAAFGFMLMLVVCIARAVAFVVFDSVPIAAQQFMLFATALGTQMTFPVLTLRMLDLFPNLRGSAASMQSFVSLMVSSLAAGVLVPLTQSSLRSMALGSAGAVLAGFALWTLAAHARRDAAAAAVA